MFANVSMSVLVFHQLQQYTQARIYHMGNLGICPGALEPRGPFAIGYIYIFFFFFLMAMDVGRRSGLYCNRAPPPHARRSPVRVVLRSRAHPRPRVGRRFGLYRDRAPPPLYCDRWMLQTQPNSLCSSEWFSRILQLRRTFSLFYTWRTEQGVRIFLKSLKNMSKTIPIIKLVANTTDGAPAMRGVRFGFVALCRNDPAFPEFMTYHCVIHQQALVGRYWIFCTLCHWWSNWSTRFELKLFNIAYSRHWWMSSMPRCPRPASVRAVSRLRTPPARRLPENLWNGIFTDENNKI